MRYNFIITRHWTDIMPHVSAGINKRHNMLRPSVRSTTFSHDASERQSMICYYDESDILTPAPVPRPSRLERFLKSDTWLFYKEGLVQDRFGAISGLRYLASEAILCGAFMDATHDRSPNNLSSRYKHKFDGEGGGFHWTGNMCDRHPWWRPLCGRGRQTNKETYCSIVFATNI